jgi:hypothetical protein
MTDQNGALALPILTQPIGNPEIIALLSSTLAEAQAGKLAGCVVIKTYGPDAFVSGAAGQFRCAMVAGAHAVAQSITASLFQKPSAIVMPRR